MLKTYKYRNGLNFPDAVTLFAAHRVDLGTDFADYVAEITVCDAQTKFLLKGGFAIAAGDLHRDQDTLQWLQQFCVGVHHGVNYSGVEISGPPLYFPFTDEDLTNSWNKLEELIETFQTTFMAVEEGSVEAADAAIAEAEFNEERRKALVKQAQDAYDEDDIKIDDNADLSESDDDPDGCFVAAWVWVSYPEPEEGEDLEP